MSVEENPSTEKPVLNATQARSGFRGRHVIWILGISLGLIVAIYAVMVGRMQTGHITSAGGQTTVDQKTFNEAKGFNTPPSQPKQSDNAQAAPATPPAN